MLFTEEDKTYMHFYTKTKKLIVHKSCITNEPKKVTTIPYKYIETKNSKPKNAR